MVAREGWMGVLDEKGEGRKWGGEKERGREMKRLSFITFYLAL